MQILAQLDTAVRAATDTAQTLSSKSLSVWFIIVVLLFGCVICYAFKLLLTEWGKSRIIAAELQNKLLDYLVKDHQQTNILVRESNTVLSEVVKLLTDIKQQRHDEAVIAAAHSGLAVLTGGHPRDEGAPENKS